MLETSAQRSGRVFQLLITAILVIVFTGFMIKAISDNEPLITKESVATVAGRFSESLVVIRTEWQVQGRRSPVLFKEYDAYGKLIDQRWVSVNKYGWAVAHGENDLLDCDAIWKNVIGRQLTVNNNALNTGLFFLDKYTGKSLAYDIEENLIKSSGSGISGQQFKQVPKICRYGLVNQSGFEYNTRTGQITFY